MILKKVSGKKASYKFILAGILCQGKKALQDAFEKFKKDNGFSSEHDKEPKDITSSDDYYNNYIVYQSHADDGFEYMNNFDDLFEYVNDDMHHNDGMYFSQYNQTHFGLKETCIPVC